MVKDASNRIPEDIMGSYQTQRQTHQDVYILIFLAVLITLTQYGT